MKKHIGFFAMPRAYQAFDEELSMYKRGKGSVQFSLNQDLPMDLINKIIKFRVNENSSTENR